MGDFQHFVPQFYLNGFLDPSSIGQEKLEPNLWAVDIEAKTVKRRAPKNIAGSSGYYDLNGPAYQENQTILDKSITKIESKASHVIRQIRNGEYQMNDEERFQLSIFIGIQLGRVPILRRHITNNLESPSNQLLQNILNDEDKLRKRFGKDAELFKEYVNSGKLKIIPKFKDETHKHDFIISSALNLGLEFAQLIFCMEWVFLVSIDNATFFTSDNPARLLSPDAKPLNIKFGELNEELEISFPISSTCELLMHSHNIAENSDISSNVVVDVDDSTVVELNWRVLPTIDKYAFCSTEKQGCWVLSHVVNNNASYR